MYLTEQVTINKNHELFNYCNTICFQSKNLYNLANYYIRQELKNNNRWLRYKELDKLLQQTEAYKTLQVQTTYQILQQLDVNYQTFFKLTKDYKNNPNKYSGRPKLPKYKDKIKGRNIAMFSNQQCPIKNGKIYLPKLRNENIYNLSVKEQNKYFKENNVNKFFINTIQKNLKQLTISPCATCYKINIIYEVEPIKNNLNQDNIMGIDLGVNNFATCVNNVGINPFIINGKPLKSINQYYNKTRASLTSDLKTKHNKYNSNKTQKLTTDRNNKVKDYMHKSSKYIIDYCLQNNIGTVVLGYNKGWKDEINMGKINKQKFIFISYSQFKQMLTYKCEFYGINLIFTEESYTSKCSFIDNELMKKSKKYLGQRKYRGLFISQNGTKINADCNAAYNIIRKKFNSSTYNKNLKITPIIINKN